MSLGFDNAGEGTGGLSSANGDDSGGAGGEEGCGALTGASNGDGGRDIGDGVLDEGESTAGCGDGIDKGCVGEDEVGLGEKPEAELDEPRHC
ncbi:hypothetical protein ACE6H2_011340 [Prunus campanulata]